MNLKAHLIVICSVLFLSLFMFLLFTFPKSVTVFVAIFAYWIFYNGIAGNFESDPGASKIGDDE